MRLARNGWHGHEDIKVIPGIPYLPTPGPGIAKTIPHIAPQLLKLVAHIVLEWTRHQKAPIAVQKHIYHVDNKITEAIGREQAFVYEGNAYHRLCSVEDEHNERWADAPGTEKKWGALGDIEFDLRSAPSGFSGDEGVIYAQHAIIGGKPHLQYTGKKLRKLTLTLNWHQMLMEDIEASFESLRTAMNEQKVMKLVIGRERSGAYYAGEFVIEDMPYKVAKYNPDMSIMGLELTVKLLEWNTGKPLEPGEHAPPEAVKNNNPSASQKASTTTEKVEVSDDMTGKVSRTLSNRG